MEWLGKKVLITGGASFIGSHLAEALSDRGADVRTIDDLSSGDNVVERTRRPSEGKGFIRFWKMDLLRSAECGAVVHGQDIVFHLAAVHGGRGFIETYQSDISANFQIDQAVFRACLEARVDKVIFASSGCVYPNHLQDDPDKLLYLFEELVAPPYDPDGIYGLAKLAGEISLREMSRAGDIEAVSCRYFTVYGERGKENQAVTAMIARAFSKQDPFEVWGDGTQIRNWTYVSDIVEGTILAAEVIGDGSAVNLGTMQRVSVNDAVGAVIDLAGYHPEISYRPDMPTGPVNRVCHNGLAKCLLGWEPKVRFLDGLRQTFEAYSQTHDPDEVREALSGGALMER